MARCRSLGGRFSPGRARASASSARPTSAFSGAGRSIDAGVKGFGGIGGFGVEKQANAQFRLFQRCLAVPVETDTALERLQRIVKAEFPAFHACDQLLQFVQRMLEFGNRGGRRGGGGGLRHARKTSSHGVFDQSSRCHTGDPPAASNRKFPSPVGHLSATAITRPATSINGMRGRSHGGTPPVWNRSRRWRVWRSPAGFRVSPPRR